MKDFKCTGKGPQKGHSFPQHAGFSDSSGKVKSVSGYTRSVPKTTHRPRGK